MREKGISEEVARTISTQNAAHIKDLVENCEKEKKDINRIKVRVENREKTYDPTFVRYLLFQASNFNQNAIIALATVGVSKKIGNTFLVFGKTDLPENKFGVWLASYLRESYVVSQSRYNNFDKMLALDDMAFIETHYPSLYTHEIKNKYQVIPEQISYKERQLNKCCLSHHINSLI